MKLRLLWVSAALLLVYTSGYGQTISERILDAYFDALIQQQELERKIAPQLQAIAPALFQEYEDLLANGSGKDQLLKWTYFYEKLERRAGNSALSELCREGQRADWLVRKFNTAGMIDPLAQAVIDTAQSFRRLAFFDVKNGDRVAEIGIGNGANVRLLGLVYDGVEIYANELNNYYLKKLETDLVLNLPAGRQANFHYTLGTENSTQLEGTQLDLIIMENVFHHIQDKAAFVESMAKSLGNGGEIVIMEEFRGARPDDHHCPDLMWRPEVDQLFKVAGFKLVDYGELQRQYKTLLRFAKKEQPELNK